MTTFDFNDPDQARLFLKGIRVSGQKITEIYTDEGRKVLLSVATDEEVMDIANKLYEDLFEGKDCPHITWSDEEVQ